ncbi:hypothetical protein ACFVW2_08095 [Streptomyces sp. NPDC058171]
MKRSGVVAGVITLLLLVWAFLPFDTDKTPQRHRTGVADLDLSVMGRPSPGSLSAVERVLARLQDQDADGLRELALDGDEAEDIARTWVSEWGGRTQRPMTADFGYPDKDVTVEVAFEGEQGQLRIPLAQKDDGCEDCFGLMLTWI